MDWWFRLHMDLPPRPEDMRELERIAPELFSQRRYRNEIAHDDRFPGRYYRESILRWIASAEREVRREDRIIDARNCPHPRCPLKESIEVGRDRGAGARDENSAEVRIDFMALGGGKKSPMGIFLDAARRVHARKGVIKTLIITDPYVFTSQSQHGTTGGIANFLQYFDIFEMQPGSTISIFVPAGAHGAGGTGQHNWSSAVSERARLKNASIAVRPFNVGGHFHDRFYLAQHTSGKLAGLFGPSMNGLGDNDFVLIGELEENVLARLKMYFPSQL